MLENDVFQDAILCTTLFHAMNPVEENISEAMPWIMYVNDLTILHAYFLEVSVDDL